MRIIYGLSGQGFGHSTRSKETIRHLLAAGHQVRIFTYGQSLLHMGHEFGEESIFEIPGLVLKYKKNQLAYLQTGWENAKLLAKSTRRWQKISRTADEFGAELVITDFEPLTALLAKQKKLPLISIDNQHQLTNTKLTVNKIYRKDFIADKLVIRSMVWGAKHYLVTTFYSTAPTRQDTSVFAPIIRQEIMDLKTSEGDYYLVYQGSDFGHVLAAIKHLPAKFVVFGPHAKAKEGNITYKSFDVKDWLKYLAGAKGVIATAGLSLMCECIYLRKPYLAIPIKRQIEQIINAQYLARMGFGAFTYDFTADDFFDFENNLQAYRDKLAFADSSGNDKLFAKLDELIREL